MAEPQGITTPSGEHVHVFVVPHTYFNGLAVCLATKNQNEMTKCKYMAIEFKKWIDSKNKDSRIITGGSSVSIN